MSIQYALVRAAAALWNKDSDPMRVNPEYFRGQIETIANALDISDDSDVLRLEAVVLTEIKAQ